MVSGEDNHFSLEKFTSARCVAGNECGFIIKVKSEMGAVFR